jgi:hypothetical protein
MKMYVNALSCVPRFSVINTKYFKTLFYEIYVLKIEQCLNERKFAVLKMIDVWFSFLIISYNIAERN